MAGALPAQPTGRLCIIAVGKAGAEMMRIALAQGLHPHSGLVITAQGHLPPDFRFPDQIQVVIGGHPVPNAASVAGAGKALELAGQLDEGDHLLVLLSGGGSALMAAPVDGISLAEKQAVTRALLHSGATISEINSVRKRLSRIKGGGLARAAGAADLTTLIISDVPGDDPALVSSGPTIPDTADPALAGRIMARYQLPLSAGVRAALADPPNDPPRPRSVTGKRQAVRIIAAARDALDAAAAVARAQGVEVVDLGDNLQGEARTLGARHAALALQLAGTGRPILILSGGETTVTVTHPDGRGGRNLEYLLGLTIALDGAPGIHAIACDTDGIDGTDRAAGAVMHPDTLARATQAGLDPADSLQRNNAFVLFEALDDLVVTGPTRTNVNDFRAILINPAN